MRIEFQGQLKQLHEELKKMGGLCETVIGYATQALTEGDTALAAKVAPLDLEIDQMERDIENLCLKLLLKQQPVAGDLRQISAAMRMITDMERIGDQSEDIAEIIPLLRGPSGQVHRQIGAMGQATIQMVVRSVDAYVLSDLELARQVIASDEDVDNYFAAIKASLITWIAQSPQDGEYALDLLMIAKYFERIGDHATNIAEWVVYSLTGEQAPGDGVL